MSAVGLEPTEDTEASHGDAGNIGAFLDMLDE